MTILLTCILAASCGDRELKEMQAPATAAVYYINLLSNERYARCVECMESCDSASADYRRSMEILLKQMMRAKTNANGRLRTVECIDTEGDERQASAYLRLTYANDSVEIILLPMVWSDDRWRLR